MPSHQRQQPGWTCARISGGTCRVPLTPGQIAAAHLDNRLTNRLACITDSEIAFIESDLLRAFQEAAPSETALRHWQEPQSHLAPPDCVPDGAVVGVSPIGEWIQLLEPQGIPAPDLARRLLHWGCGRIPVDREPVQAAILPATAADEIDATDLAIQLAQLGLRVEQITGDVLSRRLRRTWLRQIPLVLIHGHRERDDGTLQYRCRGTAQSRTGPITGLPELVAQIFKSGSGLGPD